MKHILWLSLSVTILFAQERGIVIGDGVRVRKAANLTSPEITKVNTGENLFILGTSSHKETTGQPGDTCEYYPMVQVKLSNGTTGYIFGKFIYQLQKSPEQLSNRRNFSFSKFGEYPYSLALCKNYQLGASDKDGLTFCDDFALLVIEKNTRLYPLKLAAQQNADFRRPLGFATLTDDDGSHEEILSITPIDSNQVRLLLRAYYQEGCGEYEVWLRKLGTGFEYEVGKTLVRNDNDSCP